MLETAQVLHASEFNYLDLDRALFRSQAPLLLADTVGGFVSTKLPTQDLKSYVQKQYSHVRGNHATGNGNRIACKSAGRTAGDTELRAHEGTAMRSVDLTKPSTRRLLPAQSITRWGSTREVYLCSISTRTFGS